MSKRLKHWLICLAIALASYGAVDLLGRFSNVQQLHLKSLDAHFIFRGTVKPSNIVLLLVDDKSLNTFPELSMFWHPYYAEAIRAAADAGAKALALDIAFAVPVAKWEPEHDAMLAAAVSDASAKMPVVCGYVPGVMTKRPDWSVPINMIASALQLSAYVNLTTDADDFIRRQELIEPALEGAASGDLLPRSLALRLAEKYLGADARLENGGMTLAGRRVPIDSSRQITINYAGGPGTFPHVSIADFINASRAGDKKKLADWVRGKAVLLGPDNTDDRHATPFFTIFSGTKWNTPGVEIHANTLNTLLSERYLLPVSAPFRTAAIILMGLLVTAAGLFQTARNGGISVTLTLLGAVLGTHFLFKEGWILSTSELLIGAAFCILTTIIYRFVTAENRKDLFHRTLSLFVSRHLAESLEETPEGVASKRMNVSILFSDIRGFTSFCDEKDPEEVVSLLNEYMAGMTKIIVKHGGQVNKYIGDGILAIFSDVDDGAVPGDHANRGVQCAVDMVSFPGRFETGAGVHTGMAVVGCIGSSDKMEYTVLGDTVNVASRLESLNKEHKTKMLFSETTRAALTANLEVVEIASVQVRGKSTRSILYSIKGMMRTVAASAEAH